MLTIFAIPKPFNGHIGIIQYNAIKSWTLLRPSCEVILFGDEYGTQAVAEELGVRHVKSISRNENGTPLLDDMFSQAQVLATNEQLCFINSDIILTNDFLMALKRVCNNKKKFLMIGQRWNVDINDHVRFEKDWDKKLKIFASEKGILYPPDGIDYFIFKKGMWGTIPPFFIGRPGYDNWLIHKALSSGIPVIDCTRVIMAIHQNHDYSHIKNIKNRFGDGPEAKYNFNLGGGRRNMYTIKNANWILAQHHLYPAINYYLYNIIYNFKYQGGRLLSKLKVSYN